MTTEITIRSAKNYDLCGLHLLRFLLALSILIVHFPHFFSPYGAAQPDRSALPFSPFLDPIYAYGGFAVEIFWMISGIIFYVFYMREVRDLRISFPVFLGFRLSKLYPVHFLTLLSVAILQYMYTSLHGSSFIYGNNDFIHFILNMMMINFWNAKFGLSFNGPFWSVSVEIFVYLVFFLFSRNGLLNSTKNIFSIVILFFIFYALGILSPFYECLLYFFGGVFLAKNINRITFNKFLLLILFCIFTYILRNYNPIFQNILELKRMVDTIIKITFSIILIVFFIRTFDSVSNTIRSIFVLLGNITYSVYMIHISLQLILVLSFFDRGVVFFNTQIFFVLYIIFSLVLGFLVYHLFELPAQKFFRAFIKHSRTAIESPHS